MYTKLVAKYMDGKVKKGFSDDFLLLRETFHLKGDKQVEGEVVNLSDLKAVFFVDGYSGNSDFKDDKSSVRPAYKRRVSMHFSDGEEIVGYTDDDLEVSDIIRLVPSDPLSNNRLIFVVKKNTTSIKLLDA
jgi:hypothetical protein